MATIDAMGDDAASVSSALRALLRRAIEGESGWIPFDRFMAMALYAPGLGYYANASPKFGAMPSSGSDFVTAPEMSPLFGRALAAQVAQALRETGTHEVWEFGAGSGALASQLLGELGDAVRRYTIVELSAELRERQQELLWADTGARHSGPSPPGAGPADPESMRRRRDVVRWADALPDAMEGVVVGNEVLDAMPVKLLARIGGMWHERGVALDGASTSSAGTGGTGSSSISVHPELVEGFTWADRPTDLRPPIEVEGTHDYLTEIHPQTQAFIATLGDRLRRGAAFFIDYGFPEREYWHPQRHMGTLTTHRAHRSGSDPLADIGLQDITAHVDFTGVTVAAQAAGFSLLGYTSQARFLLNCGLLSKLEHETQAGRALGHRLIAEHEMGELFKAIGFAKGAGWEAIGFVEGDRSHTL